MIRVRIKLEKNSTRAVIFSESDSEKAPIWHADLSHNVNYDFFSNMYNLALHWISWQLQSIYMEAPAQSSSRHYLILIEKILIYPTYSAPVLCDFKCDFSYRSPVALSVCGEQAYRSDRPVLARRAVISASGSSHPHSLELWVADTSVPLAPAALISSRHAKTWHFCSGRTNETAITRPGWHISKLITVYK